MNSCNLNLLQLEFSNLIQCMLIIRMHISIFLFASIIGSFVEGSTFVLQVYWRSKSLGYMYGTTPCSPSEHQVWILLQPTNASW
jgi:hypothetical protein